jgi:hypothetical protein
MNWLMRLVLATAAIGAVDRAGAASAVADDFQGHLIISAGQASEELAKYDALRVRCAGFCGAVRSQF